MQYLSDMSHCMTPYFRDDNVDIVWDIVYFALLKTAREMSAYNNFQKIQTIFYFILAHYWHKFLFTKFSNLWGRVRQF